ncbi:hypothetical protein BDF20DRAFT_819496, partial [Mycotypha africana]|uniref:uncharacterized protein n=1 Tax=Mycotypha africana TaxID=64632 RepID=UPI0022FFC587
MVLQGQSISPSSWKKDSTAINGISVLIDQFLQEAVQILGQVDKALPIKQKNVPDTPQSESDNDNNTSKDSKNNTNDSDVGNNDNDDDAIVWQLNLTPSMMTLDTSILTVSDLEKVLELIRTNVSPRPSKPEDVSKSRLLNISSSYDIPYLRQIVASVLQLSAKCSIPIAEQQHAAQYNTVQLMRHCVQSFIDCSYSFFLDLPSLVADTEMILSQPGAAREHTVETLLILSICTIMIRHTTLHHRGDMSVANILMFSYYTQAHHLLQDLFDVQHISVLQSMYLLSIFHEEHTQLFSPTKFPSTLLNMAIRMALAMDLHKLDIQNSKESDQKEKLRRLAWMLLCADYYAQWNVSGHTGFIDVSQWHVNFPQPLPNETFARRVEFFSQYCRVITIRKMDLFKSAYLYTLHSFAQTLDDDNKSNLHLFETFFNTPDTFKLNLDNLNQAWNNKSYLEPLLLHELYCHTQLFAQLPFLPKRYFDIFSRKEDKASINDLKDICRQL